VTGLDPPAATAAQVRDALHRAAPAGPFFRLEVCDRLSAPGWQPVAKLARGDLADLVTGTARQLRTAEVRVAASLLQQGIAARLWSPVLACGLLSGVVPDLSALAVSSEAPVRLGLASLSGWLARSADELAVLSAEAVARPLTAIAAALPVPLAAGLLRGNSASAMAGALGVLVRAHPPLADRALALGRALLETGDWRDAGVLTPPLAFRRRSCCLYYRVPGGGLCGDCCFTRRPG
jgi:hypothetical protein